MSAVRTFTFVGRPWYVLSCEYAHAAAAKHAWDALNAVDKRGRGKLELGCYRHQLGFGGRPVFVSVVSHLREGMEVAERILVDERRGRPVELGHDLDEMLVARRIRVMGELYERGASKGQYVLRRPPSRGAVLRPDGTTEEQIGGDE